MRPRRTTAAVVLALLASLAVAVPSTSSATAAPRLTNLAHLNFLGDRVAPPQQAKHTTYRLAQQPKIGVLWTYANRQPDGSYQRVGGGTENPDGTWGQGAFNADDVSRAAVVYLRHWQQTGATSSRDRAYQLLRGLAYLQTSSGANVGNVVLWMQPDGTLNRSADPPDHPNPSDSAESYWLARTVWAFGEGYAAFSGSSSPGDRAFADFLHKRLDLSIGALRREPLSRYGTFLNVDGERTPAWLIVNGADATAEAVLGLAAYVTAGGPPAARTALRQLADGVAALSGGGARRWPFGAVRPGALTRSIWHAWASQMPAALARASAALGDPSLAATATRDSAVFDPWLLTSGGPDNGRLPTRIDATQIAYGVDSRLQSLLATADLTGSKGLRRLAGVVGAWYFGANASGQPAYDPATGRTVDGISPDGSPNLNAGAESTIHGLLSMLALDSHPGVATQARTAVVRQRVGSTAWQAEDGTLTGDAHAVAPDPIFTDEWVYGGTGYAALGDGARARVSVGAGGPRLVQAVVELRPRSSAVTTFRSGGIVLGRVHSDDIGAQGDSPVPGALLPVTLPVTLPRGQTVVTATTSASGGDKARLDALMVEPLISRFVLGGQGPGQGHGTAVLRSAASRDRHASVSVPGSGRAHVEAYDGRGRMVVSRVSSGRWVKAFVVAGGFTVIRR